MDDASGVQKQHTTIPVNLLHNKSKGTCRFTNIPAFLWLSHFEILLPGITRP